MFFRVVTVTAALVLGNFVYQALGPADFAAAAERSFFQTGALLIFWFLETVRSA